MRAVQVVRLDGPDAVEVRDIPEPETGAGQVLIEVRAAGLTFPDVLLTRGRYQLKPDPPFSVGSEVAGVVRSAPDGAAVRAGDRVAAFPGIGGLQDLVALDQSLVFPLPERVDFAVAAGLPMNYLTVHFGLVRRGRLRAGETVLVHGAGGGVGAAAIQLAKALGARVIAVASSEEKRDLACRTGADDAIDVTGFRDVVKDLTGGRGVDIVVDPVGGDRFTDSLRSLAPEGRLLVVGFTGGEIPTVKVNRLLLNNLDVVGVGWGAFALPRHGFMREQWDELLPHVESGALSPPLGGNYPVDRAAEALAEIEQRRAAGKLIVKF
ncbi:MAG: zinc-binding dehydrogenase [Micromonosporaceae bacterium]|nr:zinc-binding dehydrogenase [Micromonosporaceae bacterium]